MTRCVDFYRKFDREGNFCGLAKSAVSMINAYKKIVEEDLASRGLDPEFTFVNFSEGASRPLHKIEDTVLLGKVLDDIAGRIKMGGSVTAADVKTWIDLESGKSNVESPRDVPTIVGSSISEPSVKSDEWTPEYEAKYPVTAACKAIGCFSLRYIKPGLHTCGFFGLRPENMPKGKLPEGCPKLPPVEPEPAQPAPAAPLQRVLIAPPSHPNLQRYTVEANRQDQMALRQMVQRGLAEDEDEAVQSCFEEGLNLFMDRIEAQIQKEEEDQEVLGE